jgi:hypothetical protein
MILLRSFPASQLSLAASAQPGLIHLDDNGVTTEALYDSLALGPEVYDVTGLFLLSTIACKSSSRRSTISAPAIRTSSRNTPNAIGST